MMGISSGVSADERAALTVAVILFALGLLTTVVGFFFRRFVRIQDERWARVDKLLTTDAQDEVRRITTSEHLNRLDNAVAKLAEVVAEQGVQFSRHIGYHERHDPPSNKDDPLLG